MNIEATKAVVMRFFEEALDKEMSDCSAPCSREIVFSIAAT